MSGAIAPTKGPLPGILQQPRIPPPLHGVNPRSIMGPVAWDKMRRAIYARHGYRCAACGVASRQARYQPWLEAHECYSVDYAAKQMVLTGMEPLCSSCHQFVHPGLMGVRINKKQLIRSVAVEIMLHGTGILRAIGGTLPAAQHDLCKYLGLSHGLKVAPVPPERSWTGWNMIWNGQSYPSPYPTQKDWERVMRTRG